MKSLYIFCLHLIVDIYPNALLQKPKALSDAEIETLANDWQTQFCWNFKLRGFGIANFTCSYEKGKSNFILQLFKIPLRSYNYPYTSEFKHYFGSDSKSVHSYYFAQPLELHQANATPQKINFDELCKILEDKQFIFYTGAGISAAAKVATMSDLMRSLKMGCDQNMFTCSFLKEIILNPKAITDAFSDFCKSAIHSIPTNAHYALNQIAQHRNICIITENVDLLQHRTGNAPIFTHSDTLYSVTNDDLKAVDVIITVGLSCDDCGFLSYYKEHNPNGIIIAINLEKPNYLSDKDFLIDQDAQTLLPSLASYITQKRLYL